MAALNLTHSPLRDALAAQSRRLLSDSFESQNLANTPWSIAVLRDLPIDPFLHAIA